MFNFSVDYLTGEKASSGRRDSSEEEFNSRPESSSSPGASDTSTEHKRESFSPQSPDLPTFGTDTASRSGVKPPHSYIALISMAILSAESKKMMLSDIYTYIKDKFPYYNNTEKAWRNSIRHNLSLNECFVKSGRADSGKGNFWSIHPACIDDFSKGDFRRRQARRRARKSTMGSSDDVSGLPLTCRYSLGYVPMTSSAVCSSTYRTCLTQTAPVYYSQGSHSYPPATGMVRQGFYSPYEPQSTYTSPSLHVASSDLYASKDYSYQTLPYMK